MKAALALPLLLALAACATPARQSGFLTTYSGLAPREGTLRAAILEKKAGPEAATIRTVRLLPSEVRAATDWLSDGERRLLQREVDAQLCFEVSERYAIATTEPADAEVRAAITRVGRTGRAGSVASAAASFFIPGPIGLRAPGTTGGLTAEAEMVASDGRQFAALVWSRDATPIGTDNPSLSRVGDALQFAEPFADAAAAAMTPPDVKPPGPAKPDPCAEYGPRIRPEGWLARFATGLYVPEMSGARPETQP
ncbi:DUF3313 domain-containing protein [Phenylobacterium sp.]|jgi:hypothetical protein|uniref:DUF3313 domain-containing protein n=1 Tax=Phenylobacterium sp. TaxID=1871053 RepID=UPI002F95355A